MTEQEVQPAEMRTTELHGLTLSSIGPDQPGYLQHMFKHRSFMKALQDRDPDGVGAILAFLLDFVSEPEAEEASDLIADLSANQFREVLDFIFNTGGEVDPKASGS